MTNTSSSTHDARGWWERNVLALGREMRLSYLPPLMVYVAAGISGLTGIVGTFFVKSYLGLSAEFLAALGFWAGLPWALKMPLGHLVDLMWKWKGLLVVLGAALIATSLGIMIGLLSAPDAMRAVMPAEAWYVLTALLAPIGYVIQDVVADAMTVEAVPRVDADGRSLPNEQRTLMHTTMQTLGRVAIIGGGVLVSLVNVVLLAGVESLPPDGKLAAYLRIYEYAMLIPLVSVLGVALAGRIRRRDERQLAARGFSAAQIDNLMSVHGERPEVNWSILLGGLGFACVSLTVGLLGVPGAQEIVFGASLSIVLFLMWRLLGALDADARATLVGTAVVIFVFRAMPGPGPGSTWWMIDQLHFDESFLARLSAIANVLTLAGLFLFRRFMAERPITRIVAFLTVAGTVLSLPVLGMYHGLHEWTAAHTGGVVDARFIALVDTALESPLGQISMVPMLAWIARSAPDNLKATYFAVMASFTNLALSASQLGTKYLNQVFEVTREVTDPKTHVVSVPADYSQLGDLLLTCTLIGLVVPLAAIVLVRLLALKSA
ncbi:MAG: hypothetical protein IPG43_16015 [Proteobacteria bacterium]|nr:hypothetical protein [Pseudomonadota bacterium]